MLWLKRRFPARNELLSLFGLVVFIVHSWSLTEFLFNLPSFLLKFRIGNVIAILSYHLTFALFESAIVCTLLLGVSVIFPSKWFTNGFVYKSFVIILIVSISAIITQKSFNDGVLIIDPSMPNLYILYIGALLVLLSGLLALVQRYSIMQRMITKLVDQISIMLFLYLPLDVIGIVIVATRLIR